MKSLNRHLRITVWLSFFSSVAFLAGCTETKAPNSGVVAPGISGNDIAGEYFSLSQLKGRVVVLVFWSGNCCSDKVKQLEPFYQKNKYNGLSVVAVEVGGSKEAVASLVKQDGLTFTNLADEDSSLARSYRVIGFPTIFVVDKKGVIQGKISGEIDVDRLSKEVARHL